MVTQQSTSVTLGEHLEKFISKEVASGRYRSADEVIKSALRLLESDETKRQSLIEAQQVGEQSGFVSDFDPKVHLEKLRKFFSGNANFR